jgi:hypothetical protein
MTQTTGRVVDGKLVLDDYPLVEGDILTITIHDEMENQVLTPEMEAELDESIAQADRGEFVPWEEVCAELDSISRGTKP